MFVCMYNCKLLSTTNFTTNFTYQLRTIRVKAVVNTIDKKPQNISLYIQQTNYVDKQSS